MKPALAFLTALVALAVAILVIRRLMEREQEERSEDPRIAPVPAPPAETAAPAGSTPPAVTTTPSETTDSPGTEKRAITAVGRNQRGTVQTLHGAWGSVDKGEAIEQIESGRFSYHVGSMDTPPLRVVPSSRGKYLRSEAGAPNLDSLPAAD